MRELPGEGVPWWKKKILQHIMTVLVTQCYPVNSPETGKNLEIWNSFQWWKEEFGIKKITSAYPVSFQKNYQWHSFPALSLSFPSFTGGGGRWPPMSAVSKCEDSDLDAWIVYSGIRIRISSCWPLTVSPWSSSLRPSPTDAYCLCLVLPATKINLHSVIV